MQVDYFLLHVLTQANEKYTGTVLLQKTMSFAGTQFQNDGEPEQVLIKGHHEAIIVAAAFASVQQMRNGRSKTPMQTMELSY